MSELNILLCQVNIFKKIQNNIFLIFYWDDSTKKDKGRWIFVCFFFFYLDDAAKIVFIFFKNKNKNEKSL
jgi:hypothetical protein